MIDIKRNTEAETRWQEAWERLWAPRWRVGADELLRPTHPTPPVRLAVSQGRAMVIAPKQGSR